MLGYQYYQAKHVALARRHAEESPKVTPQAPASSSLHAAERPVLPPLAQPNRQHRPELVISSPSSALQVLDSLVRATHSQQAVSMETKLQCAECWWLVNPSGEVHLRRVGAMCRLQLVVEVHHRRWGEMNCQAICFALMNRQEPVVAVRRGASMVRRQVVDLLDRVLALSLVRHQHLEHSAIGRQDYESEDRNSWADVECLDRMKILHSE